MIDILCTLAAKQITYNINKNMKVVIYARVSTLAQEYDRQIDELKDYAKRMNYQVVKVFSEKISGAKKIADRNALSELLDYVRNNKVDHYCPRKSVNICLNTL